VTDRIGFIGLGNMGLPMATNIASSGRQLIAFDTRPDALAAFCAKGAIAAKSAVEVADRAATVLISLPTPDVVKSVVLADGGLAQGSAVDCIVDLSTTGPSVAKELAAALKVRGITWVDAPVSGGVGGACAATLAVMVSGSPNAVDRVTPILETIGRVIPIGTEPGLGQTMKLVNNMIAGAALAITAEAMAMGAKAGIDPNVMVEVLNAGSGRNTATLDKFPKSVLSGQYDYGFAAALMLKDATLFMSEAEAMGLSLRTAAAVRQLWFETRQELGDVDFTAIAQLLERRAAISFRSKAGANPG
jgi:3-hydroxyisobutyrate dehydrogenase-like beta-hydroxyacid dehydrogenase